MRTQIRPTEDYGWISATAPAVARPARGWGWPSARVLLACPGTVVQSLRRRRVAFLHRQLAQILDLGKNAQRAPS